MKLTRSMSDGAIMTEIGTRIAQYRIAQNMTQAALADAAGVAKRTIERLEAGQSLQLGILLRVLRALDLVESFDALVPEAAARPMDLLKLRGKARSRASRVKESSAPWTWGDEK